DGSYVEPASVRIESDENGRRGILMETGEAVTIGPVEKMSKSKKNTVDPDDIIDAYGADVARWFVLSDSPPDRDVIWSDEGVQGASRFVQRLWRLVNEAASIGTCAEPPACFGTEALALRKASHGALSRVTSGIERLHFNVCLAHIREFTNTLAEIVQRNAASRPAGDLGWAIREAAGILVQMFGPVMPHLAEECWRVLGNDSMLCQTSWPEVEADLLRESTMTLVVQVNGRKRGEVIVATTAENREIEAAVLALDAVRSALDGRAVRKVIIVPKRIVNVVG
ncbi:MAG: class I tRNA ligase family protein, partial [Alphaproteobacteria bacterium]|nr:class I tRNA ligase family protein [Alphaproteobacteria bacterium]